MNIKKKLIVRDVTVAIRDRNGVSTQTVTVPAKHRESDLKKAVGTDAYIGIVTAGPMREVTYQMEFQAFISAAEIIDKEDNDNE